MMNEESLKDWEQDHIELLTSREMGEWLHRRDHRRDMNARPQGEWILNKDENPECPFCHHSFTYWDNFCSNCGADMRGG